MRASLNTLMSEVHRLDKLCAERKEAENSLRKKWKKIEEFDARRSGLESIYKALLKANLVGSLSYSNTHTPSNILLLQKDLIRKYNLQSERVESELGVRLRILPVQDTVDEDDPEGEDPDDDGKLGNLYGLNDEMNGSVFSVDRLPLLPD